MKHFCLFAAAAMLLCLCACGGPAGSGASAPASDASSAPAGPPAEAPTEAPTEAPAPSASPATEAPAPAYVSVAYAEEALPEGSYDEFNDSPTGYAVRIVFTTDAAVTDFRFLSLAYTGNDEAGNMAFETEALYTADALAPERPLVVSMTFAGLVPDRGISYVDTDGTAKYFSVEMSGADDTPLLVPFSA